MQSPFEIINANRQVSVPTRQVIQCNYFTPTQNVNAQRLGNAQANILTLAQCRFTTTAITTPNAAHLLAGLLFQVYDMLNAFKACYLDQLFDPYITTHNLMEGFMHSEDNSAQLAQLLSALMLDLIAMAPIFLEGNAYTTSSFRQGRLLILLYPFLFSEKIPYQQLQVDKVSSNTIGYQLIKKFTSILQATTVVSRDDIERLSPLQPHYNEVTLQQNIGQILDAVNKSVLDTIAKKQLVTMRKGKDPTFQSKYQIVQNTLNQEPQVIMQQSKYLVQLILRYLSVHKEQCLQCYLKILVHLLDFICRTYLLFIEGILLSFQELKLFYLLFQIIFQQEEMVTWLEIHKQIRISMPQQDSTQFSKHFIRRLNQQARLRDPLADGGRLLNVPIPPPNQAQIVLRAAECATNDEAHQVIDGTGQFITNLTLRTQREYVSNYLLNAPPQLEMRAN